MKNKEPKKTAAAVKPEEARTQEFKLIPYDQVRRSEGNPRKTFDEAELKELAASIQDQGIIQPLVVRAVPAKYTLHAPELMCKDWIVLDAAGLVAYRETTENTAVLMAGGEEAFKPYFELLAGERRYRAAEIAGLKELPCMVRTADEIDAYKVRLMENDQRVNLNDLERAKHYQKGIEENGFTADTLAQIIKKSRSHVFGMLALLRLSEPLREALQAGKINKSIAERIAQIPEPKQQEKLLGEVLKRSPEHPMSVRDVEREIEFYYMVDLERAKFDLNKKSECGSCTDCPKRTGNMVEMFPNLAASPDICTDPACFASKTEWHHQEQLTEAQDRGLKTIALKESEKIFSNRYLVHDAPYVKADVAIPNDPKARTYRHLVKKAQLYAAIDGEGNLQEMFRKEDVVAPLEKAGVKVEKPRPVQDEILPETSEEKRKRELAHELAQFTEKKTAWALFEKIESDQAINEKSQKAFWLMMVRMMLELATLCDIPATLVLKRRGCDEDEEDCTKLEWQKLRAVAVEMLAAEDGYDTEPYAYNAEIIEIGLKSYGMDVKAVEKRIKAEFAEANRLPKQGEKIPTDREKMKCHGDEAIFDKSYCADTMQFGRIREPYAFRGALWVNVGGMSQSGYYERLEMEQVIPATEFKGTTCSYAEKSGPGQYKGIKTSHGKTEYVFTGLGFEFVQEDAFAKAPEKKPAAKGKAKKKK